MIRALLALCLCGLMPSASAADLLPFEPGAMARILAARQGRPFALTLWSIECPHCKDTLRQFSALTGKKPDLDLVVVNTDHVGEKKTILAMLAATGFAARDTWVFGDAAPERLRYEIDRRWGGEMPRTYLFDADHKVVALSGPLAAPALQQWLERNGGAPSGRSSHEPR